MHYLYVTHVSHTYHIRLCELDHDLGSFSRISPSMAEAVWDVQEDLLEFSRIRKA